MPTSSSVRDLTKLFEPTIADNLTRSSSNISLQSRKSKKPDTASLECNQQLSLLETPGDEHFERSASLDKSDTNGSKSDPTSSDANQTDTTTSSSNTGSSDTSASSTSPSKETSTQPDTAQSPVPQNGDSSDGSVCQFQEYQRSPPIEPPSPTRPLGHMGGNIGMFLKISTFTEAGEMRQREGIKLFELEYFDLDFYYSF